MSVDLNLLEKLVKYSAENDSKFSIFINDQIFNLLHVSIENSPIPVNEPTTRGGVYFSEKFAYKIKGIIEDLSVVPLLTKKMLGPNTEFGELRISCNIQMNNKSISVDIFTNLTNSLQTPNSIELSMIIVKLESS
ncbi:MAG: hypothetical protein MTP07_05725 [Candidatus Nitrosopumilus limneticus]|nr:hypothetical protein [Candidatus Nitrosopumilus limneticus]MDC4212273.1 hypothetical protein [Candidatus Nitrosopumilus limneticus]MDC4215878.1 hypothetical protein [Candidatus Nitrosopumilus limneticus]MDC4217096.1 hypothetical protein [Candidatus Nitrosopumilus limneticus]MDC4219819.1 hypothetical protein [Candidatus Nitrosopumilus limneticus]